MLEKFLVLQKKTDNQKTSPPQEKSEEKKNIFEQTRNSSGRKSNKLIANLKEFMKMNQKFDELSEKFGELKKVLGKIRKKIDFSSIDSSEESLFRDSIESTESFKKRDSEIYIQTNYNVVNNYLCEKSMKENHGVKRKRIRKIVVKTQDGSKSRYFKKIIHRTKKVEMSNKNYGVIITNKLKENDIAENGKKEENKMEKNEEIIKRINRRIYFEIQNKNTKKAYLYQ